ncbi:hypothetical protein ACIRP2_01270 [Streptomyces sp. NPDC101194]|uniref:hypothetical protein n=1 Tax=Streptomyces sp. NPDC101194 TaxID=3366127 RepID=UPI0038009860
MGTSTHRRAASTGTGAIGAVVAPAVTGGTAFALTATVRAAAAGAARTGPAATRDEERVGGARPGADTSCGSVVQEPHACTKVFGVYE